MRPNVLALYRSAPARTRLHLAARWRLFPFRSLEGYVPAQGKFADLGCGHGLWAFNMALLRPAAEVWGLDPDPQRIEQAQQIAQAHGIHNAHFSVGKAEETTVSGCALISIIDMIYLIPPADQVCLLQRVVDMLAPGGTLLLKEMSTQPRWKWVWNMFEETLATRLLNMTYGRGIYFQPEEVWSGLFKKFGLQVEKVRLDAGFVHPHVLFVGRKF